MNSEYITIMPETVAEIEARSEDRKNADFFHKILELNDIRAIRITNGDQRLAVSEIYYDQFTKRVTIEVVADSPAP